MDRASLFFKGPDEKNLFDYDESLPALPLPDLESTLERYYESLKPFGSELELEHSRSVIEKFKNGVGKQLHAILKERTKAYKNWLDVWWDAYGYHVLRMPLLPYCSMQMPLQLNVLDIPETPEYLLKNLARIAYYTTEFWDLVRREQMKPLTSNGGKIKYTSVYYKRFFSIARCPGEQVDYIETHFKSVTEGPTPIHVFVMGKGRFFVFDVLHPDGSLISIYEWYVLLQRIKSILDSEPLGDCVPVLTNDERTDWAKNRKILREISSENEEVLKLIESSCFCISFDDNEPQNNQETSQLVGFGDYHSKWGDKGLSVVAFKSGRFGFIGEHSAHDGTYSISYATYVNLSFVENSEPDWNQVSTAKEVDFRELKFNLNQMLKSEIERVSRKLDERKTDVIVTFEVFEDFGKEYLKECRLHPDSFTQVIMMWTYARLHNEIASTYETALMRQYYNGRTETLRSTTNKVHEFIKRMQNPSATKQEILASLRSAVEDHNHMMNEARKGHGVDRHLFGLWCAAHENKIDIPGYFFDDPLYKRSGGGGNFMLSSSTLGYSHIIGFVCAMIPDGYGVFYGIAPYSISIHVTSFRDSTKTNANRFTEEFIKSFREIKSMLDDARNSSL